MIIVPIVEMLRWSRGSGNNNDNNNNDLPNKGLCCSGWSRVKLKKSKKRDKYLDLAEELNKTTMEHGSDGDSNRNKWTQ